MVSGYILDGVSLENEIQSLRRVPALSEQPSFFCQNSFKVGIPAIVNDLQLPKPWAHFTPPSLGICCSPCLESSFPGRSSLLGSFSPFRFQLNGPCTERTSFINLFIGSASLLDSITLPGYYPDSNSHYPNHFVLCSLAFLTPTPTMSHMPPERWGYLAHLVNPKGFEECLT